MKCPGHERVDLARWMREFTLEREIQEWDSNFPNAEGRGIGGHSITSPRDLAIVEHVRRHMLATTDLGRTVPTDIFVMALGEPKLPYLTKVGGVPFRPRTKEWPRAKNGRPFSFLCQHCFIDSVDLFQHRVPGDVLLHFVDSEMALMGPECGEWCMEWQNLGDFELLTSDELPTQSFVPPSFHGQVCRYQEYPEDKAFEAFEKTGYSGAYLFATTQATRIGGTTWYIQGEEPARDELLLCTLSSISLNPWTNYPFINHPDPLPFGWSRRAEREGLELMIGDVGCIYWFLNACGDIRVSSECY
jgi:Domain of unknown function (DUF1963)